MGPFLQGKFQGVGLFALKHFDDETLFFDLTPCHEMHGVCGEQEVKTGQRPVLSQKRGSRCYDVLELPHIGESKSTSLFDEHAPIFGDALACHRVPDGFALKVDASPSLLAGLTLQRGGVERGQELDALVFLERHRDEHEPAYDREHLPTEKLRPGDTAQLTRKPSPDRLGLRQGGGGR